MMRRAIVLFLLVSAAAVCEGPPRMELLLEKREGDAWRTVDPGLVLAQNDRVRFRFRANFDGYLYVMNRSTSGKYEQLFPREETGRENRIVAGKDYVVPATQAAFRIAGPAGHEVVYWMVTPVDLSAGEGNSGAYVPMPPPPPKEKQAPSNITPRCDGTLFRARGACIDSSAGPKDASKSGALPENLAGVEAGSRDLLFLRKENTSVVSSPEPLTGPVIYEFRLAHR